MNKILIGLGGLTAGTMSYIYLTGGFTERIIPWQYPTNINTWNYWWDLQSTTNLIDWTTEQTNLGPGNVTVTNDVPVKFFRMRGRP